jgi:hypothetical protein
MPAGKSDREHLPHPRSAGSLATITEPSARKGADPKHPFQSKHPRSGCSRIQAYRINIHITIDVAAKSYTFR